MRTRYFYGYNIVAAGFAIQAVSMGALFAYGVLFKEFQTEFGWSRATISFASSLAFFVMGAAGILAGRLNDRIVQLPGLSEQAARPDMSRSYYAVNALLLDEAKAGMSRESCVKALQAEGVPIGALSGTQQHKLELYQESEWWHHKPEIPDRLPGCELANATAMRIRCFTKSVPELIDQYVAAFEKVWAHRDELG